ncbi:MoxR family ATPase [candidate division KSB1 bacterium]|nr:MoxR family ATPase [candidate division KSB1 bacterium]NIR73077.1 MoxR family ATPase [candidate division KSB1 bacterium]NIS28318.1 MoxR family ATPase [candidate division KSB1 bacterium]NIT75187.1 MoxR family ATPase [candidate division KSB1 bacterium]NIU29024.1 MoxR family ATPase [candidate division KSB1 bacterium]
MSTFSSIDDIQKALQKQNYIAERNLSTSLFLALKMGKPLFLEGEAGVGKTEVAKVLAKILNTELIRLQCYEGLDVHNAVYEWNYARQMLHIRLLEAAGHRDEKHILHEIFSREFLIRRPLLQAIETDRKTAPVLLIDELDRADEEFEAFLLELLSDFQITIPEIGTISTDKPPVVVITSNRTREIHDALKRRCLYFWIDYPSAEKEFEIVQTKVPDIPKKLAREIVAFVQELRTIDLYKLPGVAETLDWSTALATLTETDLRPDLVDNTLGTLLKYQDDIAKVQGSEAEKILSRIHDNNLATKQ